MVYSKNIKINKLIKELVKLNWEVRRGKKHCILITPFNYRIAIPSTPSDYRAEKNFYQQVKRLELKD